MPLLHHRYELGKHPPRRDPRNLRLARYLTPSIRPAPQQCGWTGRASRWGMMGNDTLGDCTCAAAGHMIQAWTSSKGVEIIPPDDQIISLYQKVGGYVPGDKSTDKGAVELEVLKYLVQHPTMGYVFDSFVELNVGHQDEIKQAIYLFGGVYAGFNLPITAMAHDVWTCVGTTGDGTPGSWGGHAVPLLGYDSNWVWFVSWGQLMPMSWGFIRAYMDEGYALLASAWTGGKQGVSPVGFSFDQLQSDLEVVTA